MLDEALTWAEARARCKEGSNEYLAVANSVEQFNFLRGMYDKYRANNGSADGVWIDGKFDAAANVWNCYSNYDNFAYDYNDVCQSDMPWSSGGSNTGSNQHCILVWHANSDGVKNYGCSEKMPAICATKRYFALFLNSHFTAMRTAQSGFCDFP